MDSVWFENNSWYFVTGDWGMVKMFWCADANYWCIVYFPLNGINIDNSNGKAFF